ncbi:F0F1 ATP synthase subunit delta [Helicobacter sp. 11S02629-2]|uniref:F0F1 ATP synthase subunit delta n=1 Tax=Helicobacter sp. 11S02629-2 TaxID=1476195 RepID=UPI000BA7345E|nr:F0F1 ATP synthase subunit delta [Helicobacter sp. 11S02629-2]PAF45908.1 hypothetical protein BKH40_00410 [Helicobacter sp. 11S02629-2]
MQLNVVARKYAKAIVASCNEDELKDMYLKLKEVSGAFELEKFCTIIHSHAVLKEEKIKLVLSLASSENDKLENLLVLLTTNNRLELIPFLVVELKHFIDSKNRLYDGVLHVNKKVSGTVLESLKLNVEKRLNITLNLTQSIEPVESIKLSVVDLGVEIAFSKERFVQEMQNYILKAI